jgi:5'-phosphate synthase pdxT subunit
MKIGVLALQGAFSEHIRILKRLGAQAVEVRRPAEMDGLDGLIIPGGESTTIVKLADAYGLREPIRRMARAGKPVMGTCAGLILLASAVSDDNIEPLKLMDMTVRRNAFGRQVDSFETQLDMPCLGKEPCHAVFIRAPLIDKTGGKCEVLATLADGAVVAVRQDNLVALAFHPELSHDDRVHRYFLNMVEESSPGRTELG